MLGGPLGTGLGTQGATWLSDVLGMGDYTISNNSLIGGQGVPMFGSSDHTVRIRHREFLGDISGSTGFVLNGFALNPGLSRTFPWLSGVAENFQMYKLHGCLFEFVSTSATALNSVNTALGTVVMATNYNARAPDFVNKPEMEQYEFSCSTRPSCTLIHPIECKPSLSNLERRLIRTGSLAANDDLLLYDIGNFQLATVGMQAESTIGELWVTYDVELYKPKIASGGTWPGQVTQYWNLSYDEKEDILGDTIGESHGDLGIVITDHDTIVFPAAISAGRFLVSVSWIGSTAASTLVAPTCTYNNCTQLSSWAGGLGNVIIGPSGGTDNSKVLTEIFDISINGYDAQGSSIVFGADGNFPDAPLGVQIMVVSLPLNYDS